MSYRDLEQMTRSTAARFVGKYVSILDDIEQLRSDIGSDRWADRATNDPAVWFEWVQAFWEELGATFLEPVVPGSNAFETRDGERATLDVPYDGSDPTAVPRLGLARPGAERASLDEFRTVLANWGGSLDALEVSLSEPRA